MSAKDLNVEDESYNIPSELMDFINKDSYSLLIKGHAGTGKTTLALTILKILNIKENFQYITTRISPAQMYNYYPWFVKHFNNSEHIQKLDENSETNESIFVDARLDEPSSMFERITNQLMDVGSPMIIIDTWDAISYFMDKEAVMNNARVLQTWRERAKAKMIFISDNPQDTTFDVLVDGIVELSQSYHNNRLLRKITTSKMRGIKINRHSYKFTLNKGMFRSFEPYRPLDFAYYVPKINKKPLLEGRFIKSGINDLDEAIGGGFPLKSIASINVGPKVNSNVALAIINQIISRFLFSGNPVVCQYSQIETNHTMNCFKKINKSKTNVELIFVNDQQKAPKSDKTSSLSELVKKTKTKNPTKSLLCVISSNSRDFVTKNIHELKQNCDLTIIVNMDSQQDRFSKYVDVNLEIQEINGTLFLQPNVPWSHLFAVIMKKTENGASIKLESIV